MHICDEGCTPGNCAIQHSIEFGYSFNGELIDEWSESFPEIPRIGLVHGD